MINIITPNHTSRAHIPNAYISTAQSITCPGFPKNEHTGYYMAMRRYKISPVMFLYYIKINEIPNHFTLIVFCCERSDLSWSHGNGDLFTCEDNMLFSQFFVKISCFHAKAHLVQYIVIMSSSFIQVAEHKSFIT